MAQRRRLRPAVPFLLNPGEKRFVGKPMPPDAAGYRLTVRHR
jgi:hypothetical protein